MEITQTVRKNPKDIKYQQICVRRANKQSAWYERKKCDKCKRNMNEKKETSENFKRLRCLSEVWYKNHASRIQIERITAWKSTSTFIRIFPVFFSIPCDPWNDRRIDAVAQNNKCCISLLSFLFRSFTFFSFVFLCCHIELSAVVVKA